MTPELEIDDAIMLLLGAPSRSPRLRDRIEGVTKLEKLIFLLERETDVSTWLAEDAGYVSHNFGPFSAKVYQAAEILRAAGLIEDSASLSSSVDDSWETEEIIGTPPLTHTPRATSL